MVQLCPDAGELVAAARRLDKAAAAAASAGARQQVGSSSASSNSRTSSNNSSSFAAFCDSLAKDAAAMSGVQAHYAAFATKAGPEVELAIASLTSCRSCTPSTPHVYTTGIGKSGAVAARFAISLRSLGIRASFAHGAEWTHGDLGAAGPGDVIFAFSHSGKTAELLDMTTRLTAKQCTVFSITNDGDSPLAVASRAHFPAPAPGELLGSVPTRSIVAQEAVCNALLSAFAAATRMSHADFKANHPGGSIGAANGAPK